MRKVLSAKQLPNRVPIFSGIVSFCLLDLYQAPGWLWGVVGTVYVLVIPVALYSVFSDEYVELEQLKTK